MNSTSTLEILPTSLLLRAHKLENRFSKVSSLAFFSKIKWPPTYPLRPLTPNNARTLCIAAAAGTELASTSYLRFCHYLHLPKELYSLKIDLHKLPHELSLGQAFAHCPRFLTAASK